MPTAKGLVLLLLLFTTSSSVLLLLLIPFSFSGGYDLSSAANTLFPRAFDIHNRTVFDTTDLPWAALLRRSHGVVAAELRAFEGLLRTLPVAHHPDPDLDRDGATFPDLHRIPRVEQFAAAEEGLNDGHDSWRALFLRVTGEDTDFARVHFPRTLTLLRRAEVLGMRAWNGFISVLEPLGHIPPHHGIYRGIYRYHLGIEVPAVSSSSGGGGRSARSSSGSASSSTSSTSSTSTSTGTSRGDDGWRLGTAGLARLECLVRGSEADRVGRGGGEEAMETEMEIVRGNSEGGGSWNRGGSGTAGAGGEDAVGERKRGIRNADAAGLKYGWFSFGWAEGRDVLFDDCEPHQVNRERAAARRRMLRGGGG